MALSPEEREAFLAEPHIAALAVDGGAGRAPLTIPIWYWYEPGGEAWVMTGRDSRKALLITQAGRCSLMVDRVTPTVRYVSAEGPVTGVAPPTDDQPAALAHRYLPPEAAEAYLKVAEGFGPQVVIRMRPEHWLSSDMGSFG